MNRLFDYRRLRAVPTALLVLIAAGLGLASYLFPRTPDSSGRYRAVLGLLQHRSRIRESRDLRALFVQPR